MPARLSVKDMAKAFDNKCHSPLSNQDELVDLTRERESAPPRVSVRDIARAFNVKCDAIPILSQDELLAKQRQSKAQDDAAKQWAKAQLSRQHAQVSAPTENASTTPQEQDDEPQENVQHFANSRESLRQEMHQRALSSSSRHKKMTKERIPLEIETRSFANDALSDAHTEDDDDDEEEDDDEEDPVTALVDAAVGDQREFSRHDSIDSPLSMHPCTKDNRSKKDTLSFEEPTGSADHTAPPALVAVAYNELKEQFNQLQHECQELRARNEVLEEQTKSHKQEAMRYQFRVQNLTTVLQAHYKGLDGGAHWLTKDEDDE